MCATDDGVPKDTESANYWYQKVEENRDAYTQFVLALRYDAGEGLEKNTQKMYNV